jgi:hypothetical protein
MLTEGFLQRRELGVAGEAFDGDDFGALGLHREHQAGAHGGAIDENGAGAAHAVLAADMGAGQPQMMAQAICQREPRLDVDLDLSTVDAKSYRHGRITAEVVPPRA